MVLKGSKSSWAEGAASLGGCCEQPRSSKAPWSLMHGLTHKMITVIVDTMHALPTLSAFPPSFMCENKVFRMVLACGAGSNVCGFSRPVLHLLSGNNAYR